MPQLNVIPALTSLLFQDKVTVFRRRENVNGFGEGRTDNEVFRDVPCVVYPGGQNKLDRRPESQSTNKVIEMVGRFAFCMAVNGFQADVVVWKGEAYTVVSMLDYSAYGSGFTQAMAELRPVLAPQPTETR